ncbi:MAG TPA: helix-turn-helix transcriptional regulator [Kofleriaceae bacterium]|nr:helix-turn-helix transcriptional regulator [Kofleriaceae bacterium]
MSGVAASLLLASVHSIVLAIVLRRRGRNRRANGYLGALLAVMAVLLFDGFLRAEGVHTRHPHVIGLTAWVPFALGPLVYLYVREMTSRERAPAWRHFVVTGVYLLVLCATFFPRSASYKRDVAEHHSSWMITALEVALLVYGLAYAIAALVRLRGHREHVEEVYSNLHGVSLRWLFVLSVLNALVWIAAIVAFVIRMSGVVESGASSLIVPIGSTITVFVIGYFQLGQAEILVVPAEPSAALAVPPDPKPAPSYQRARLANDDAAALEARMRAAMTDKKLYVRSGLTLPELADEVAATPHEVSQVLSTRLGKNFYTFINEHRIEHVKVGLRTTDRPVLDLALEAGFQSKSTFNAAFRKATGTTPSEFRQRTTS